MSFSQPPKSKPKAVSPLVIDHSKHSPEEEAGPKVTIMQPKVKDALYGNVTVQFKVESVVPITDCECEYFIDYQKIWKSWISEQPYYLDTTQFPDGSHWLTVNVCDGRGHIGTATMKIRIDNQGQEARDKGQDTKQLPDVSGQMSDKQKLKKQVHEPSVKGQEVKDSPKIKEKPKLKKKHRGKKRKRK